MAFQSGTISEGTPSDFGCGIDPWRGALGMDVSVPEALGMLNMKGLSGDGKKFALRPNQQ